MKKLQHQSTLPKSWGVDGFDLCARCNLPQAEEKVIRRGVERAGTMLFALGMAAFFALLGGLTGCAHQESFAGKVYTAPSPLPVSKALGSVTSALDRAKQAAGLIAQKVPGSAQAMGADLSDDLNDAKSSALKAQELLGSYSGAVLSQTATLNTTVSNLAAADAKVAMLSADDVKQRKMVTLGIGLLALICTLGILRYFWAELSAPPGLWGLLLPIGVFAVLFTAACGFWYLVARFCSAPAPAWL